MKKKVLLVLLAIFVFCLAACNQKPTDAPAISPVVSETPTNSPEKDPTKVPTNTPLPTATPEPSATPTPTATPEPTLTPEEQGLEKSKLTGLYIPKEYVNARPYAFMINNIHYAYPQSSLSKASVVYEMMVEYGITRFLAVYEAQMTSDALCTKVGSVRSARRPLVEMSKDFDSILVHFGGSEQGYAAINEMQTDHIDGMGGTPGSNSYFRDNNIPSPHNAFVNLQTLAYTLRNKAGYRTTSTSTNKPFNFNDEDTNLTNGAKAKKITLKYSTYYIPYFVYNESTGTYDHYETFSTATVEKQHKDAANGDAITFENVIIMFVKQTTESTGRQTIELSGKTGAGYYLTNGEYISISWDRTKGYTRFFDAAGNEITLNPGKTYISLFPNYNKKGVVIE